MESEDSRQPGNLPSAALMRAAEMIVSEVRRLAVGRDTPLLVALDGCSGAGKSTLAVLISAQLGAALVQGDDFYAPNPWDATWEARGPAARVAEGINWRRLRAEALEPLLAGKPARWHAALASLVVEREPTAIVVLEGLTSTRPELTDLIDVAVLVDAPIGVQHRRLEARWGKALAETPHVRWHLAEEYYFTQVRPASTFDLVVTTDDGLGQSDG
jgi:uridine kinase